MGSRATRPWTDLLIHGLQIYYAEQRVLKALPKMIEKATNRDPSPQALIAI